MHTALVSIALAEPAGEASHWSTGKAVMVVLLCVAFAVSLVIGIFVAEECDDSVPHLVVGLGFPWVILGVMIGLLSVVALGWYVVICVGFVLLGLGIRGLVVLGHIAAESPPGELIYAAAVLVVLLGGAATLLALGHPWWSLYVLMNLLAGADLFAFWAVEEDSHSRPVRRRALVASMSVVLSGAGGLGMVALALTTAFDTAGNVIARTGGGVIYTGLGLAAVVAGLLIRRESYRFVWRRTELASVGRFSMVVLGLRRQAARVDEQDRQRRTSHGTGL